MSTTIRFVLQRATWLGEIERQAMIRAMTAPQRFTPNRDLISAGTAPPGVSMILSGFACRYVTLQGGQRQILGYLLPGDIFDVRACFAQKIDFSVQALSEVRATTIPRPALMALTHQFPHLMQELWRLAAIEDAITRQWQLNAGRRSALQRLSHLLCECFVRLRATGAAHDNSCFIPMTQADIADALALTAVHVNRTLKQLRKAGLAVLKEHRLTLLDGPALYAVAEFEPGYLQIDAASSQTPSTMARSPWERASIGAPPPSTPSGSLEIRRYPTVS